MAALFAEALINRTPWQLWDLQTGEPAEGADTPRRSTCWSGRMARLAGQPHPGLLHIYVHTMEMSPFPERALPAADRLARTSCPTPGTCSTCRRTSTCCAATTATSSPGTTRAIVADRKYLEREGPLNFYTLYRCHNYHFKIYGAMFLGQLEPALEAADEMAATLSEELLRIEVPPMADWLEGFVPMRLHVLIRFGRWREIIDEPLPADRGAVLHDHGDAALRQGRRPRRDRRRGRRRASSGGCSTRPSRGVPDTRYLFNNTCLDILAVAAEMLDGEIAYRSGDFDEAFAHLRRAVELDDNLPYDEPWGWMQPTRHALGALLLEQGRVEEAEAVYRADLGLDDTLPPAVPASRTTSGACTATTSA